MSTQGVVFEVRMPTYERPEMLRRAMESLQAQTYPNWYAAIFDDSRSFSVQYLVDSFGDDRFHYRKNPERLGAAYNIDQCFNPKPKYEGTHACILEDDNFFLPNFLKKVERTLYATGSKLLLANQRIYVEGSGLEHEDRTTRGAWFRPGWVSPEYLRATLLLTEGVSNGGLFWALDGSVDLRVGQAVELTGLHEACRSLLISEPFYFLSEAEAVWTSMPRGSTARANERNRTINRGMQTVRDFVLDAHGCSLIDIVGSIPNVDVSQLVRSTAYSGYACSIARTPKHFLQFVQAFSKGYAIRILERSPCKSFVFSKRVPRKLAA
jgi:hypothetical protein